MLAINIAGFFLITLIVWWFWLYKSETGTHLAGDAVIRVANGNYDPAHVSITSGQSSTLRFLRIDESPCAVVVVFADLDISQDLAVGEVSEVALPALPPGNYPFTCQMQMYRGELIVEEV
jgi:plastocyanin domain-containing protein